MKALIFISLLIFFLIINYYSYKFGKKFVVINYFLGFIMLLIILILFLRMSQISIKFIIHHTMMEKK